MKSIAISLYFILSSFHFTHTGQHVNPLSKDGWIYKNETDHIKVWYRTDTSSGIYSIRATTSFQCNQSNIIALLDDADQMKTWGYKVLESRCCRKISNSDFFYYARYELPWPMSDRDLVMHTKRWQSPDTEEVFYEVNAAPEEIPKIKGLIRIQNAHSSWRILPTREGWTYCEWIVICDPGGAIPDWLVNMSVARGPVESMKGMRRVL